MYAYLYKQHFQHLVIPVRTHHLSMSSLITWHGAGTASLESGMLTEESWILWRCTAAQSAVKYGYRLVTEMKRKAARTGREEA